jgi:hypothetical protein
MEVYWDRIAIGRDLACEESPPLVRHLAPRRALLRRCGYPREEFRHDRAPPAYDYERRDRGLHFRNLAGDYTRWGEVRELLAAIDDRFVIFGQGEEITLEFDATGLPPAEGERTYVLRTFGYCKDRDVYTGHSGRVKPLPFRAMSAYPYPPGEAYPRGEEHARYRREWNTRRVFDR